jgi:hypothetical protein
MGWVPEIKKTEEWGNEQEGEVNPLMKLGVMKV